MSRIREFGANEKTRRLAFVRERALRDEVSLLNEAKREGRQEAEQRALEEKRETILHLLAFGVRRSACSVMNRSRKQLDWY